jgi:hypothetical protein
MGHQISGRTDDQLLPGSLHAAIDLCKLATAPACEGGFDKRGVADYNVHDL